MMDINRPEIRIEFDGESSFESQGSVRGHVSITCNKTLQLREIRVKCKGFGEINWIRAQVQTYFRNETYVDQTKIILTTISASGIYLSPGNSQFPFEFQLPNGIPSTYESWSCRVKYSCKATITFVTDNISTPTILRIARMFHVKGHYDISNIQNVNEPASFLGEKVLTRFFGCCFGGTITTSISINKKAYKLGEYIHIAVNIINKTNQFINIFEARLMRMTSFKDGEGIRKCDHTPQTVCCIQNQFAQRPRSVGWARTSLRVPETIPPTNLGSGCTLFKVSYYLKLVVGCTNFEKADNSLRIFIPIKIGYTGPTDPSSVTLSSFDTSDPDDHPPSYEDILRDEGRTCLPSIDDDTAPPPYDLHAFTC